MYYPDLSTSCQFGRGEPLRAIGWLEQGRDFPTGDSTEGLLPVLKEIYRHRRWLPSASGGVHFCQWCPGTGIGGAQALIVPTRERIYIAPDLITHYVEAHRYRPPEEFVQAVLECPRHYSRAYLDLLVPHLHLWRMEQDLGDFVRSTLQYAEEARAEMAARGEPADG